MEALRSAIINNEEDDNASLNGMYGPKGFFFQQRRGHLDLRGIAHVNMDRLIREVDIDSLQQHIENITFCNLREDDLRYMTDPQIVKLFRLSVSYSVSISLIGKLSHLSHFTYIHKLFR